MRQGGAAGSVTWPYLAEVLCHVLLPVRRHAVDLAAGVEGTWLSRLPDPGRLSRIQLAVAVRTASRS
ncbi:MAG: hypothetical protein WA890_30365 [Micromonospora sp.]